jgi:hypothetical protein
VHAIDTLYAEHLGRGELPPRAGLEHLTGSITDEDIARGVAGRYACALPSAEALDYLRRHLRGPLLSVAAGIGFWAHCAHHIDGTDTVATDRYAPEENPRFRRAGWHPVERMDALEALRRYPDHDVLGVCLPPGLSLQQIYEASPAAAARQLFIVGYFTRQAFGGGREGIMSKEYGLKFRRVDCIARWGLEAPDYQTVLIHVWRG